MLSVMSADKLRDESDMKLHLLSQNSLPATGAP